MEFIGNPLNSIKYVYVNLLVGNLIFCFSCEKILILSNFRKFFQPC